MQPQNKKQTQPAKRRSASAPTPQARRLELGQRIRARVVYLRPSSQTDRDFAQAIERFVAAQVRRTLQPTET